MSSCGNNGLQHNHRDMNGIVGHIMAPRQARLATDARQSDDDDLCVYQPVV